MAYAGPPALPTPSETPAPQASAPQPTPVQPVQLPVPPNQPVPTQPIQHMPQLNWSHFQTRIFRKTR